MRWCSGCVKGGGLDRVVQRGFGWRDAWEEYPVVQPQEKRSMPGQEWQGRRGRNSVRSGRNSAAVAELVGVDHYDLRASKGTRKAWNCSPLTNKASVSILAQKHQSRRVSVTGGHSDATLAYQGLNQPWECWCFFFKKKFRIFTIDPPWLNLEPFHSEVRWSRTICFSTEAEIWNAENISGHLKVIKT